MPKVPETAVCGGFILYRFVNEIYPSSFKIV